MAQSFTSLSTYTRCRYAYKLRYLDGWKPLERPSHLTLGTLVHAGFASGLQGFHPEHGVQAALEDYVVEVRTHLENLGRVADLGGLADLGVEVEVSEEDLLENVKEYTDPAFALKGEAVALAVRTLHHLGFEVPGDGENCTLPSPLWETVTYKPTKGSDPVPLVEAKLRVNFAGGQFGGWVGVVDWVARNLETGQVFVFDLKVRQTLRSDRDGTFDLQLASYQKALARYGVETAGSCVLEVRGCLPKEPQVNKDGSVSRRACATDWETYSRTVLENGGDPNDYLDVKAKLQGTDFFKEHYQYRSKELVEALWLEGVQRVAWAASKSKQHHPRSVSNFNCAGCLVRDLCWAELRGEPLSSVTARFVKTEDVKDPGHKWVPDEEAPADDLT